MFFVFGFWKIFGLSSALNTICVENVEEWYSMRGQERLNWLSKNSYSKLTKVKKKTGENFRGVTFAKIVRECACRTSKIWLSLYHFSNNFPIISILFSIEKRPILSKLGAFYNDCSEYTHFMNSGSFVFDENPPIAILNFAKKAPKKAGTYINVYHVNMRPPPEFYTLYLVCLSSSS